MRVPLADLVALEDRGRVLRSRWGLGCLCFRWWVKGLRGLCPEVWAVWGFCGLCAVHAVPLPCWCLGRRVWCLLVSWCW